MTLLKMAFTPAASPKALPLHLATAAPVTVHEGFYEAERDGLDSFRWMGQSGELSFEPATEDRYLELWVLSEFKDLSQRLTVSTSSGREATFDLQHGWSRLSAVVPAEANRVTLHVNKIFPAAFHSADSRTLAVRIRPPLLHRDDDRHRHIVGQYQNAVINTREMIDGRTELASTPVTLGIDLHGACNVKPPCVYCEWDFNKEQEGDHVDTLFNLETLKEFGPIFDNAVSFVNCSIGEPFMMKEFDDLLDAFGNTGKLLEMTTNGQILTDRNIQRLLGRNVDLYISLDAGTPQTYARLRNDKFDAILHNLDRLIAAKGGPGGLPRVHLVFMPMRANVHELDQFIHLCARLKVDRMVLRPLNYSDTIDLDWDRAGYRFRYADELLPFDELVRVSGRAAELCHRLGVELADQMDFGGAMGALFQDAFDAGRSGSVPSPEPPAVRPPVAEAAPRSDTPAPALPALPAVEEPLPPLGSERVPACLEPWKSLYVLRRGVFPCCYGASPIAPMDQYRAAWNSDVLRDIRHELAEGRFHDYCVKSVACPIIRKAHEAHALPAGQELMLRVRRVVNRVDRATHGGVGRTVENLRWVGARLVTAATHPSYVLRHTRRLARAARDRVTPSR